MRGGHLFPATDFPHFATSDHFPAELQIPCEIAAAVHLGLIPPTDFCDGPPNRERT